MWVCGHFSIWMITRKINIKIKGLLGVGKIHGHHTQYGHYGHSYNFDLAIDPAQLCQSLGHFFILLVLSYASSGF